MDVLCDHEGTNICAAGGVGIFNPGFSGMNIEQGKTYKLVFYTRSSGSFNLSVSLTGSNGLKTLATVNIVASDVSNWTRIETTLQAKETDANSRLQLTTTKNARNHKAQGRFLLHTCSQTCPNRIIQKYIF